MLNLLAFIRLRRTFTANFLLSKLCLLLLVVSSAAASQQAIDISGLHAETPLGNRLYYLLESGRQFELADVVSGRAGEFIQVPEQGATLGHSPQRAWLRIRLTNSGQFPTSTVLDLRNDQLHPLRLYQRMDATGFSQIHASDSSSDFANRPLQTRTLAFEIEVQPGQETELLLYVGLRYRLRISPVLLPKEEAIANESAALTQTLVFSTIFFILIITNLFHSFAMKKRVHLYYSIREFVYWVFVVDGMQFGFQYLWPSIPIVNLEITPILGSASLLVTVLFVDYSLELRRHSMFLHRITWAIALTHLLMILLTLVIGQSANYPAMYAAFVMCAHVLFVAVWLTVKGDMLARFHLFGIVVGVITTSFYVLQVLGYLQTGLSAPAIIMAGTVVEGMVIYYGLYKQFWDLNDLAIENQAKLLEQTRLRMQELSEKHAIEKAAYDAEKALRENELALAKTSHDIRQPMFSAQLALAGLKNDTGQSGMVENLNLSLKEMASLLAENVDREKIKEESTSVETIAKLLQDVRTIYSLQAEALNISFTVVPSSLDVKVASVSLRRILSNLITNSFKHAFAKRIVVGVRRRVDSNEIWVLDNGRGIPQGPDETAGDGLGLRVVTDICDKYGWRCTMRNSEGKGLCVIISIAK